LSSKSYRKKHAGWAMAARCPERPDLSRWPQT
jgi:hypothetical protein